MVKKQAPRPKETIEINNQQSKVIDIGKLEVQDLAPNMLN